MIRNKKDETRVETFIAWYLPEDWERLREISDDKDVLEPTHARWLQVVEPHMSALREQGLPASKVIVRPDALLEWCRRTKRRVDAPARAAYAAEEGRRRSLAGGSRG